MSRKEVPARGLVKAALAGKITNQEGARALRLSVRQFKRLKARFRREGARGVVHRRRGRPSPRRFPPALREQIVTLMTTTYAGFNDVHLTEKLQELHALPVSRATVRRLRLALGRAAPRRAPRAPAPGRRPRAPAMGQLVQLDASPFAWLEDRGPERRPARPHRRRHLDPAGPVVSPDRGSARLHSLSWARPVAQYGVPVTLYGDRLSLFRRNDRALDARRRAPRPAGSHPFRAHAPGARASASSPPSRRKPKAASNACGAPCRTASSANCACARSHPRAGQRVSARPSWPTSSGASRSAPAEPTAAWRPAPRDLAHVLSCRYTRVVARGQHRAAGRRAGCRSRPGRRPLLRRLSRRACANSSMAGSSSSIRTPSSPRSRRPARSSCSSRVAIPAAIAAPARGGPARPPGAPHEALSGAILPAAACAPICALRRQTRSDDRSGRAGIQNANVAPRALQRPEPSLAHHLLAPTTPP